MTWFDPEFDTFWAQQIATAVCIFIDIYIFVYLYLHMKSQSIMEKKIIKLARRFGVLRIQDLKQQGIHPEYLRRMCKRGFCRGDTSRRQ